MNDKALAKRTARRKPVRLGGIRALTGKGAQYQDGRKLSERQ